MSQQLLYGFFSQMHLDRYPTNKYYINHDDKNTLVTSNTLVKYLTPEHKQVYVTYVSKTDDVSG